VSTAGSYNIQYRVASLNGGGNIQLKSGATTLATTNVPSTSGWQTWTTVSTIANLAAGTQTLRIQAGTGGYNLNWIQFSSSVDTPPQVSISSPVNNASFTAPASITIQANASDANGTVTQVAFYNGNTLLGTDTSSPYSFTWSNVAAGSYSLTARATDNTGNVTTSSAINVNVTNSSNAPIGQTITLLGFNGRYVNGMNGTAPMQCTSTAVGTWEKFVVVDAGGGKIALRSMSKYVSSENGATSGITCNRTAIGGWEMFDWVVNADGKISLRGNNGLYVSSENGTKAMTCTRTAIGGWEAFTYAITTAGRTAIPEQQLEISLEKDMVLSPNPGTSAGALTIHFNEDAGDVQLHFKDVNGAAIFSSDHKGVKKELTVELPALAKGIYLVGIRSNTSFSVKKYSIR
jgi:hypothetical protein